MQFDYDAGHPLLAKGHQHTAADDGLGGFGITR